MMNRVLVGGRRLIPVKKKMSLTLVAPTLTILSLALGPAVASGRTLFAESLSFATGDSPRCVAIGDLNGDGNLDLVTADHGSNTVSVLLGTGSGTFGVPMGFGTGIGPSSVAIADLNGDGTPDLAVANTGDYSSFGNTISVLLGNGDGTFGLRTDFLAGTGPRSIAAGDLSGDGAPDLAVANLGSGTLSFLLGNGNGTFAPRVDYVTGSPGTPTSVAIGDLNGDGNLDLAGTNTGLSMYCGEGQIATAGSDPPVVWLLGNGDGTFGAGGGYYGDLTADHFVSVAIGNLNGDGNQDLALAYYLQPTANVSCSSFDAVAALTGNGDGTFGWSADCLSDGEPSSVAIGDLNGDGIADLVTANQYRIDRYYNVLDWNTASVFLGNGDGTFAVVGAYPTGLAPSSVGIGDLNGDGRPDLVTADEASNTVSVLVGLLTAVEQVSVPGARLTASVTPNPLLPSGTLHFTTTRIEPVRIRMFDIHGRVVRTLMDSPSLPSGPHEVAVGRWGSAGENLGAGVYLFRIDAAEGSTSGRMVLLK